LIHPTLHLLPDPFLEIDEGIDVPTSIGIPKYFSLEATLCTSKISLIYSTTAWQSELMISQVHLLSGHATI
jgi:hypothetical protein